MKRNQLALSLAGLLLAPASGAVFAQSAAPQDQQSTAQSAQQATPTNAKQLQTITVTGSALPRVDTETPSPVTVITAQQIARSGYTTIADVVRSVSADNSGSIPNAFSNGFAAGASGVALRGLTVNSTLVLVDGHRVTSYPVSDDGERSFVDLNTIPLAAVERVEVLKDGASSIYGADAIAGVVNIILRPNFKGIEATGDVGTSQHGGGFTRKATLLAGGGDLDRDHYNGYFSVQYQKDNEIMARQRNFPINTSDLSSIGGSGLGGAPGRAAGPNGAIQDPVSGLWQPLQPCTTGPLVTVAGQGSWCSFDNTKAQGQIQPAMEQGGIYGRFTIKLNDTTRAYLSASYMQSRLWAPTPVGNSIQTSTPINTNNITLPANNPYNPFGAPAAISYNFSDIPSGFNYDNHSVRLVGGVSGTVGDWNYDVTGVLNHSWLDTRQYGFLTYSGIINAINNGTYNFVNPSTNSYLVRQSLAPGYAKTSTSDMDVLDFAANRQLWDLPGGPLGLALGAQVRHEAQNDPTLNPNSINPLTGQPTLEFQGLGNAHTKGSREVTGVYAEFDMPLLEQLEVDASGRFDHYSDVGNNFSPKIGVKWKPLDWIALRGTYSKGFRAPSFAENGSSAAQGFVTYQTPAAFQAMHSAQYNLPYALAEFTQANPHIKPEKATNFTFGIVVQPATWLSASIDYYNIKKSNVIVQANTSAALAAYYAGTPQAPGVSVVPDIPDTPPFQNNQARPSELIGEYINANTLKTTGVDLDLQAHFDFANNIHYISELTGTQIFEWKMQFPDGTTQTYVGTQGPYNLSSGAGTPRTRASWANTVEYGPLTVTGTLYFTSSYADIAEDVGVGPTACITTAPDGSNFPLKCRTGPTYDFDITASYAINDHISVTGSIMNVFDRGPPFDPANYSGTGLNYNPTWSQANAVGRFYNLGVKVKF
jgi:iron complex outermembrane receptor protein